MTPEQQGLLQKAQRSLQAAKILNQENFVEFAAARAYYTMFYVAQALLLSKGLTFSTHAGVISAFGQQFVRTEQIPKEFHRHLIAAERIRLQGDYDIDSDMARETAADQIAHAANFLELAQQILESSSIDQP
jgi:uncharacterized protein (UPF0332 family)